MARPTVHHPAVQIAIPILVGLACYRGGEMIRAHVEQLPVKMVHMQAQHPALPALSLPTVYIAGSTNVSQPGTSHSLDSLFGGTPQEPVAAQDGLPAPAAPVPAPEPTLCERMAGHQVDGITSGGVFINGVFYRFNDRLIDLATIANGSVPPVVTGVVQGKVRIKAGKESCDLEFKH